MQAFHNSQTVKTERLLRVQNHMNADNLLRGATGQNGKGCAVWCTLDKYDHAAYEPELGIPEWLACVEDTLFEGMSIEKSRTWPRDFLEAINVGADLEKAKAPFLIMVLRSTLDTFDHDKFSDVLAAINGSIALWERPDIGSDDWNTAARVAADAAADAAWAAWAAWAADAARVAADAARVAADAAAEAAAAAAWAAAEAAAAARYDSFADGLLEILRGIE